MPPIHLGCSLLMLILLVGLPQHANAQDWQPLTIAQAIRQAQQESKPVLVYLSAPACLACHRMDALTWPDPSLGNTIDRDFIAIRPGLDELDAAMDRFNATGFPTLIRLDGDQETARVTGFRTAQDLLSWLKDPGVFDVVIEGTGAPVGDVHDRAMDLLSNGNDWAAAARALAEVWMRAPVEPGVTPFIRWLRQDRYPSMLRRVCENPDGRAEIEKLIEGFPADGPAPDAHSHLVSDWLVLSAALQKFEVIDTWITRNLVTDRVSVLMGQPLVFDRLAETGRWADAGRVADPQLWSKWVARQRDETIGEPGQDVTPDRVVQTERRQAPVKIQQFIRALHAAGRDEDAAMLEQEL